MMKGTTTLTLLLTLYTIISAATSKPHTPSTVFINGELRKAIQSYRLSSPKELKVANCLSFFEFNYYNGLNLDQKADLTFKLPRIYSVYEGEVMFYLGAELRLMDALRTKETQERLKNIRETCIVKDLPLLKPFLSDGEKMLARENANANPNPEKKMKIRKWMESVNKNWKLKSWQDEQIEQIKTVVKLAEKMKSDGLIGESIAKKVWRMARDKKGSLAWDIICSILGLGYIPQPFEVLPHQ